MAWTAHGLMIRDASHADAAAVRRLHARVVPDYPPPTWSESGTVVLVAEQAGGRVVGYLTGVLDGVYSGPGCPVGPPHGYVQALAVDPDMRLRGSGRALVQGFVCRARAVGARWVFALPDEGRGVEHRVEFFGRCGFSPVDDPDERWPVLGRWT